MTNLLLSIEQLRQMFNEAFHTQGLKAPPFNHEAKSVVGLPPYCIEFKF
jgi:hypothetical protein